VLLKWDVLRVRPPGVGHPKLAVCISPRRVWFFYVNSKRPQGRKRGPLAIELQPYHGQFLTKVCFLDTTECPYLPDQVVKDALATPADCLGTLSPTVRSWVVACVRGHGALEPEQRFTVLEGEP